MERGTHPSLIADHDQTLLIYVSHGKYTFNFRGEMNVPIKEVNDEQITGTFSGTIKGNFLPIHLIYQGKSNHCFLKHKHPASVSDQFYRKPLVLYWQIHWIFQGDYLSLLWNGQRRKICGRAAVIDNNAQI